MVELVFALVNVGVGRIEGMENSMERLWNVWLVKRNGL